MSADSVPGHVPFEAHVELLRRFLEQREQIVERIDSALQGQRSPSPYMQGRSFLTRQLEDCFFSSATASQSLLRGQLEAAYCASGFQPRQVQHLFNDIIHPVEMMLRAVHCWQQTRWPGRGDRLHYAHTLFNVYVLRCLQFLSLRIWDEEPGRAGQRLTEVQSVLDQLWSSSPTHQPAMVRDARWLIPLAQSLITDELAPYFEVSRLVAETLPPADVLEIHRAHARMLGGHLTSQIRHYSTRDGLSIDDPSVVVRTRTSNALDLALLVESLVTLLRNYESALNNGDENLRLHMAGAILQGISPDPELFLNRVDMLRAYSMIEHVFISVDADRRAGYSAFGERYEQLLQDYGALIHRLIRPLRDDLPRFQPVNGGCSPFGVLFGLPTNLIEHMALKAVQRDAETRFSIEDIFEDTGNGAAKLAWVNGWRKLPHVPRETQRAFEYPQQYAEEIYQRIERELGRVGATLQTGRLYIEPLDEPANVSIVPEVPPRYIGSSDAQMVAAHKAEFYDRDQLLRDRQEGHFLVSYETPGGWVALKKNLLAEVLGAGQDARITGLPSVAAEVLRLMCAGLTASDSRSVVT